MGKEHKGPGKGGSKQAPRATLCNWNCWPSTESQAGLGQQIVSTWVQWGTWVTHIWGQNNPSQGSRHLLSWSVMKHLERFTALPPHFHNNFHLAKQH